MEDAYPGYCVWDSATFQQILLKIKCIFEQKKGYVENYPYFGRNSIFLEKPHKKEIIHQWLAPNFECKSTEANFYLYDFLNEFFNSD